jgi:hypothetical protein
MNEHQCCRKDGGVSGRLAGSESPSSFAILAMIAKWLLVIICLALIRLQTKPDRRRQPLTVATRQRRLTDRLGERCRHHCHKSTDRGSVWVVIRVGFDYGHADHSGVGNKGREQWRDMIQSQAGPVRGDIGQRQVESVQNVDIEMHH